MRHPGMYTSHETQAPAPALYIVAYFLTHTTSLVEQEGLQKLQKRYEAAGSKVWSRGSQGFKPALCCEMITSTATKRKAQLVPFQNMSSRLGTIRCSAMDGPIARRLCKGNDIFINLRKDSDILSLTASCLWAGCRALGSCGWTTVTSLDCT